MMELYFQWKFIKDMIGLVILGIILILMGGLIAYIYISDWWYDRKRKKEAQEKARH